MVRAPPPGDGVERRRVSTDEDLDVGPEIDEIGQVAVELLGELNVRSVVGVGERDQLGVGRVRVR